MLTKLLAAVKHKTFVPQRTFPQVKLARDVRFKLVLPLDEALDVPPEVVSSSTEDAAIVEVRDHAHRLEGLGFVDQDSRTVQCFHVTKPVAELPTIDNAFFAAKLDKAFQKRRSVVSKHTTCYRGVHGVDDLFPGVEIDHYCASFYRVFVSSFVGERLLAPLLESLRDRGAEQVIVESPSVPATMLSFIQNTSLRLPDVYQEDGIQLHWHPRDVAVTQSDRWLINPCFRRARRVVRDASHQKKVLCLGDRGACMALNAMLTADQTIVVESDDLHRERISASVSFNHGQSPLRSEKVRVFHCLDDAVLRRSTSVSGSKTAMYDIITIEATLPTSASASTLSPASQLFCFKAAGAKAQNAPECTVKRLLPHLSSGGLMVLLADTVALASCGATVVDVIQFVGKEAAEIGKSATLITHHGPSIDYPMHCLNASQGSQRGCALFFLVD